MAAAITYCPSMPAHIIDKPQQPHLLKKVWAASAETEISMQDYQRMQTITHSLPNHPRTGIPQFMLNPERLREVIVLYMEKRAFPSAKQRALCKGTFSERLHRVEEKLAATRPHRIALLDSLCARFIEAKRFSGDKVGAHNLENSIQSLDTQLRLESKLTAVIASVLYLSYMAAQDSVGVAQQLGVTPYFVRQVLYRVRQIGMSESERQTFEADRILRLQSDRKAGREQKRILREKERDARTTLRAERREAREKEQLMAAAVLRAEQEERRLAADAARKAAKEARRAARKTVGLRGSQQRWEDQGLCIDCGGKHGAREEGKVRCRFCLDRNKKYGKAYKKKNLVSL